MFGAAENQSKKMGKKHKKHKTKKHVEEEDCEEEGEYHQQKATHHIDRGFPLLRIDLEGSS